MENKLKKIFQLTADHVIHISKRRKLRAKIENDLYFEPILYCLILVIIKYSS